MFSGCPCVSASVRAFVRASDRALILLAQCVTNQLTEFYESLLDDVAEGTGKLLTRF